MKNITIRRIWLVACGICLLTITALLLLSFAESSLPARRTTHECKPDGSTVLRWLDPDANRYGLQSEIYEQAFCPDGHHAEFKDSISRTVSNISFPVMLISAFVLAPTSLILLYRSVLKIIKK